MNRGFLKIVLVGLLLACEGCQAAAHLLSPSAGAVARKRRPRGKISKAKLAALIAGAGGVAALALYALSRAGRGTAGGPGPQASHAPVLHNISAVSADLSSLAIPQGLGSLADFKYWLPNYQGTDDHSIPPLEYANSRSPHVVRSLNRLNRNQALPSLPRVCLPDCFRRLKGDHIYYISLCDHESRVSFGLAFRDNSPDDNLYVYELCQNPFNNASLFSSLLPISSHVTAERLTALPLLSRNGFGAKPEFSQGQVAAYFHRLMRCNAGGWSDVTHTYTPELFYQLLHFLSPEESRSLARPYNLFSDVFYNQNVSGEDTTVREDVVRFFGFDDIDQVREAVAADKNFFVESLRSALGSHDAAAFHRAVMFLEYGDIASLRFDGQKTLLHVAASNGFFGIVGHVMWLDGRGDSRPSFINERDQDGIHAFTYVLQRWKDLAAAEEPLSARFIMGNLLDKTDPQSVFRYSISDLPDFFAWLVQLDDSGVLAREFNQKFAIGFDDETIADLCGLVRTGFFGAAGDLPLLSRTSACMKGATRDPDLWKHFIDKEAMCMQTVVGPERQSQKSKFLSFLRPLAAQNFAAMIDEIPLVWYAAGVRRGGSGVWLESTAVAPCCALALMERACQIESSSRDACALFFQPISSLFFKISTVIFRGVADRSLALSSLWKIANAQDAARGDTLCTSAVKDFFIHHVCFSLYGGPESRSLEQLSEQEVISLLDMNPDFAGLTSSRGVTLYMVAIHNRWQHLQGWCERSGLADYTAHDHAGLNALLYALGFYQTDNGHVERWLKPELIDVEKARALIDIIPPAEILEAQKAYFLEAVYELATWMPEGSPYIPFSDLANTLVDRCGLKGSDKLKDRRPLLEEVIFGGNYIVADPLLRSSRKVCRSRLVNFLINNAARCSLFSETTKREIKALRKILPRNRRTSKF